MQLSLILLLLIPTTVTTAEGGGCRDLYVIFARGSGQKHSLEKDYDPRENQKEYEDYKQTINSVLPDGNPYQIIDLAYPAVEAGISWNSVNAEFGAVWWGAYRESQTEGVNNLTSLLNGFSVSCPDSRFIVAGYSQGAHVVGDTISKVPPAVRDRIVAVNFFGDPKYNSHDPNVIYRGTSIAKQGSLEARVPYVPQDISYRTTSYCLQFDPVCENDFMSAIAEKAGIDNAQATHGNYSHGYTTQAAKDAIANYLLLKDAPLPEYAQNIDSSRNSHIVNLRAHSKDIILAIDLRQHPNRLNAFKDNSQQWIVNLTNNSNTQVGIVTFGYRDDPEKTQRILEPTENQQDILDALKSLQPENYSGNFSGGGAYAVRDALESTDWRSFTDQRIVLITGGVSIQYETFGTNVSSYAQDYIVTELLKQNTAHLDVIYLGGPSQVFKYYQNLTRRLGGVAITNKQASDVSGYDKLVDLYRSEPVVYAGETYYGNPLMSITFNAEQTDLRRYKDEDDLHWFWDLNNDNIIDEFTEVPRLTYSYEQPYQGSINVQVARPVTVGYGKIWIPIGNASPWVEVGEHEQKPIPPPAPFNVAVEAVDATSVEISWSFDAAPAPVIATTGTGNDTPAYGFEAFVIRDQDGYPVYLASPESNSALLTGLEPGIEYSFTVESANGSARAVSSAQTIIIDDIDEQQEPETDMPEANNNNDTDNAINTQEPPRSSTPQQQAVLATSNTAVQPIATTDDTASSITPMPHTTSDNSPAATSTSGEVLAETDVHVANSVVVAILVIATSAGLYRLVIRKP